MYKKFTFMVLGLTVFLLTLIVGTIIIIDPFFHYHEPYIPIAVGDHYYQNPGILKNYDYNCLITGSSMTENFRASWFDEGFDCKTIKVPYPGGFSKNYEIVFSLAFQNQKMDNIFFGWDYNMLIESSIVTRNPIPEYLYDDSIFNDIKYFLNKTILFEKIYFNLKANYHNIIKPVDDAYMWNDAYTFSKSSVLNNYSYRYQALERVDSDYYRKNYEANIQNIIPYIKNNPLTNFYIFFPPYSILFWDNEIKNGTIDATFSLLNWTIEDLLEYPNVHLYLFQDYFDITTNLDNYKDYTHYNIDINKMIYEHMKKSELQLTKENYQNRITKMKEFVEAYDYEAIWN